MKNTLPIRVLVAGGTTSERGEIEQAIQVDHAFSIVPLVADDIRTKVDADAVVLIQDGAPQSDSDDSSEPVMLPLPLGGAPAVVVTRNDAGTSRMAGLSNLPHILRRAILSSREAASVEQKQPAETAEDAANTLMATRAMRESQRLAAIGKLTAEIAHEINNPLESVGNLLYLAMREPGMPARAVEYLRSAEREMQRIVQISKQTLSFSRESAEPVLVRVTELMDEVVGLYSRRIGQKKLAVIREYSTTDSIPGMPGELRQVFSNLVTNAIEATAPGGTLRLRIRTVVQHLSGTLCRGLRITVGDTGAGIPEPVRSRLGQMFFTTKGESGTGLGLWVTKGIIARYGGTLQLRSSTGASHGTVFSIFLPLPTARNVPGQDGNERVTPRNVTEISRHPLYSNHAQREIEPAHSGLQRNG